MKGHLTRRDFLRMGLMAGACTALGALPERVDGAEGEHNVLFIAVDDLRTTLGCYGAPLIRTPNIDELASRGTLFRRAYCQQAVCSPSRTSLLTGRRPDTTRIYDLQTHFRKFLPDVVTLPQHFKQHGYHSAGISKIYHGGLDDPGSWSVPHMQPKAPTYLKPESLAEQQQRLKEIEESGGNARDQVTERDPETGIALHIRRTGARLKGPSWEDPDVDDGALQDGKTADEAIRRLKELKDQRFFLGVGFVKPHLPFVAPKKYFDLYPLSRISPADNPFPPEGAPEMASTNWGELRNYTDMPASGPLSEKQELELIRGYYAATSYVDAQIGRVLKELDRLGLRKNTVVVLWGDHGWHLGDHGLWCKHTNFEEATHAPLIFSSPGQKHAGVQTDALAEFVDIYPTLCDLAGLPAPEGVEGVSVAPVMAEPGRRWKNAAFSQYPRGKVMGYSIRTDRYRYTEWSEPGQNPVAVELYDYEADPQGNVNVAEHPEQQSRRRRLSLQLRAGWKAALPPA